MAIKFFADYHTHTTFTHGKGTVEENVRAAIDKGLRRIAIAEHGPRHITYGVRKIDEYFDEIARVRDLYSDKIEVLAGLECNIISLDGKIDVPEKYLDKLDIVLFGSHKFAAYSGFKSALHFYITGKHAAEKNAKAYALAIERYKPFIVTHPGYNLDIDYSIVAEACAKHGTAFEINNKHHDYTAETIAQLIDSGCKFAVSSDAHSPNAVGVFDSAIELVIKSGLPASSIINAEEV